VARFLWPGGAGVLSFFHAFCFIIPQSGHGFKGALSIFFKGRPLAPVFACFLKRLPAKAFSPFTKVLLNLAKYCGMIHDTGLCRWQGI
jgi:hypothetical protein